MADDTGIQPFDYPRGGQQLVGYLVRKKIQGRQIRRSFYVSSGPRGKYRTPEEALRAARAFRRSLEAGAPAPRRTEAPKPAAKAAGRRRPREAKLQQMSRVTQHLSRISEGIETRTVTRTVEVIEHRCVWCGDWFETTRTDAKMCPQPKPCRLKAHRAKAWA